MISRSANYNNAQLVPNGLRLIISIIFNKRANHSALALCEGPVRNGLRGRAAWGQNSE